MGDVSSRLAHSRCRTHVHPANVGQNGRNWLHVRWRTSDMTNGRLYVGDLRTSTERSLPCRTSSLAPLTFSSLTSSLTSADELLGFTPRSASLPAHRHQIITSLLTVISNGITCQKCGYYHMHEPATNSKCSCTAVFQCKMNPVNFVTVSLKLQKVTGTFVH